MAPVMVKPTKCAAAAMLAMHIQSISFLLIKIGSPQLPSKCNRMGAGKGGDDGCAGGRGRDGDALASASRCGRLPTGKGRMWLWDLCPTPIRCLKATAASARRGGWCSSATRPVCPSKLCSTKWGGEFFGSRATTKQELADAMELVAQGRITPVVDRMFALAEVESAFGSLRREEPLGRNVLTV